MEDVIQILLKSEELKGWNIKPFGQLHVGEGITYEFSTTSNNGIKAKDTLKVTVISYRLEKAVTTLNIVAKLLVTIGDDRLTDNVLHVEQNGGSTINNIIGGRNMYFVEAIFDVTRRL